MPEFHTPSQSPIFSEHLNNIHSSVGPTLLRKKIETEKFNANKGEKEDLHGDWIIVTKKKTATKPNLLASKNAPNKSNRFIVYPSWPTTIKLPHPIRLSLLTLFMLLPNPKTLPFGLQSFMLKMFSEKVSLDVRVLLEQGCFTSHLLSFDNNKVLKIINWIC